MSAGRAGWLVGCAARPALMAAALGMAGMSAGCVRPVAVPAQFGGDLTVSGLEAPAWIERDGFGVPRLRAASEPDLYFLQGFAHAQDRFWMMEMLRRSAAGRLSEVVGRQPLSPADGVALATDTVRLDAFQRLIGFRERAGTTAGWLQRERPGSWRLLQAYADGVNAYLAHARASGELPWEFQFFNLRPEPWTPLDTLAIYRLVAWFFSHDWTRELLRWELMLEHPDDPGAVWRLFPIHDDTEYPMLTDRPRVRPFAAPDAESTRRYLRDEIEVSPDQLRQWAGQLAGSLAGIARAGRLLETGSNAFAVAGRFTASGRPLLAGDPHATLLFPSLFLDNWLSCDTIEAAGVSLAGVPGLLAGHNFQVAWTLTDSYADTQDLTLERPADAAARSTLLTVAYAAVPTLPARRVARFTARYTADGRPMLDSLLGGPSADGAPGIALRWTGFDRFDETAALNQLLKVRDAGQLESALEQFHAPAINFIYADRAGNIGVMIIGRLPRRAPGATAGGLLPAPGWKREFDWQGYRPFAENPRLQNPPHGYVISANNLPARFGALDEEVGYDFREHYRARRLRALIGAATAAGQPVRIEDAIGWQNDVEAPMAQDYAPMYAAAAEDPRIAERLRQWTQSGAPATADSAAAAIFYEAHRRALELTYRDEMSARLFEWFVSDKTVLAKFDVAMRAAPDTEAARVFDDRTTPQRETRAEILGRAVLEASRRLRETFGTGDMDRWAWGGLNRLEYVHHLGERGPLRRGLHFGVEPRPGGRDTVSYTLVPWPADGNRVAAGLRDGAVFKFVVDLDDPHGAQIVHYAGQSGRVLTRHFLDQAPLWRDVSARRYRRLTDAPVAGQVLMLRPRG
jgi:penicillin amidase